MFITDQTRRFWSILLILNTQIIAAGKACLKTTKKKKLNSVVCRYNDALPDNAKVLVWSTFSGWHHSSQVGI